MDKVDKGDYEKAISSYYGEEQVRAIIQMKVDTKEADVTAEKISSFPQIEDLFLVTGDTDLIAKVGFDNYTEMKNFIVDKLSKVEGIKDTKTLMIVTAFKEKGDLKIGEQKS